MEQPRTGINEGVKVGVLGIGALVLLGAAFYVGRKLLSSQLPKVQKVTPLCQVLFSSCRLHPPSSSRESAMDLMQHSGMPAIACLAIIKHRNDAVTSL